MKKNWYKDTLNAITDNGRAEGREIVGNIYERFGNTKGSIIVSVFAVMGIVAMPVIGFYSMGKKVFSK